MISIFLFKEGEKNPVEVKVDEKSTFDEFLNEYLSNTDTAGKFFGYNQDSEREMEGNKSFAEQGVERNHRIVLHKCKKIDVVVYYSGLEYNDTFNPHNKVEKVLKKSLKHFDIDSGELPSFELYLNDSSKEPLDRDRPIGCYIQEGNCTLELVLAKPVDYKG